MNLACFTTFCNIIMASNKNDYDDKKRQLNTTKTQDNPNKEVQNDILITNIMTSQKCNIIKDKNELRNVKGSGENKHFFPLNGSNSVEKEREHIIEEQECMIEMRERMIKERIRIIKEQECMIEMRERMIVIRERMIKEKEEEKREENKRVIEEQERIIVERERIIEERERIIEERERIMKEINAKYN